MCHKTKPNTSTYDTCIYVCIFAKMVSLCLFFNEFVWIDVGKGKFNISLHSFFLTAIISVSLLSGQVNDKHEEWCEKKKLLNSWT